MQRSRIAGMRFFMESGQPPTMDLRQSTTILRRVKWDNDKQDELYRNEVMGIICAIPGKYH